MTEPKSAPMNAGFDRLEPVPYPELAPLVTRVDTPGNGGVVGGEHLHLDFYSLYLVLKGRGAHAVGGVPYAVARGDVFVMTPGQTHCYEWFEGMEVRAFYFQQALLDVSVIVSLEEAGGLAAYTDPSAPAMTGKVLHLPPDAMGEFEILGDRIQRERRAGTRGGAVLARLLFLEMLIRLARHQAASSPAGAVPADPAAQTVAAAVRILEARFGDPAIRIEQIAAELCVSPDRLAKLFAGIMGRTPRDYLTYLRLERAKTLLAQGGPPVSEVGVQAGFLDAAYFARAFRAATGVSPSDFRRRIDWKRNGPS